MSDRSENNPEKLREALAPYYRRFLLHKRASQNLDISSPSHPDNMKKNGKEVRSFRNRIGLTCEEVASGIGENPIQLRAYETGLIPPDDLPETYALKLRMFLQGGIAVANKINTVRRN